MATVEEGSAPLVAPKASRRGDPSDPWEPVNRKIYGLNGVIDRGALRPLAMAYRRWLPRPIRNGLHNAVRNLDEPDIALNDILQGRLSRAGVATVRFVTNSIVGVGGLFDVARHAKLAHHDNDFGITLGRYHLGAGPYLYLPIRGPSNLRDTIGIGVDFVLDPVGWARFAGASTMRTGQAVIGGLDTRAGVDDSLREVQDTSIDPYATLRSFYQQIRASEIHGGPVELDSASDFPDETGIAPQQPDRAPIAAPLAPGAPR
jgi:phospholipid-binding lipoprotein MlaA